MLWQLIVWFQVIESWLYEVLKILHCDISLNNLMLCKEGDNVYAVLNDLDLTVSADVMSMSSNHCMGTKPFMAIYLIHPDPTEHMYHHDLESLFYILVWITSRFNDGQEIVDPPLQEWADNDGLLLAEKKWSFFRSMPPWWTTQFEPFRHWIVSMWEMFDREFLVHSSYLVALSVRPQSLSPVHFAHDTLGGLVTFDKFQTILEANLLWHVLCFPPLNMLIIFFKIPGQLEQHYVIWSCIYPCSYFYYIKSQLPYYHVPHLCPTVHTAQQQHSWVGLYSSSKVRLF